jgi:hypothetical protein
MEAGLNGGEQHEGDAEHRVIESFVVTPEKLARLGIPAGVLPAGWWIGQKVSEETFAKVALGDRMWFSIEGVGERDSIEEREAVEDHRRKAARGQGGECRWRNIGGRPVCITSGHAHVEELKPVPAATPPAIKPTATTAGELVTAHRFETPKGVFYRYQCRTGEWHDTRQEAAACSRESLRRQQGAGGPS